MASTTEKKSVFAVLNAINCNEHTEKKNGLTYLSWAWAWQMVKKNFPDATYTIYEREDGVPYFTDGKTCWVKTGVTINGQEYKEYLPIMDYKNCSVPLDKVTSMDMNKAIQRSLTKAAARHGLGLYIYAGEDLPEEEAKEAKKAEEAKKETAKKADTASAPEEKPYKPVANEVYWKFVESFAKGIKCKSGRDCRSAWIAMTNARPEDIAKFDKDVENYNTI